MPDTVCDLHVIINDCLIILNNQIKDRVQILKHYTDEKYTLMANVGKMHQAFLNILINASQAIADKGIINIFSSISKDKIKVEIIDNGSGISGPNLKRIFDPFYTTKEPGKGTGLGLSITYNIIKEHNGEIIVESVEGKGTKVSIFLPLKKDVV
jgi:signal transduction histidine kinase